MATLETSSDHPLPLTSDSNIEEQVKELTSILPREKWLGGMKFLYKYKGFWLLPNQLRGHIAFQNQFEARENDVVLVTTPKSGTTWLKALLFALLNRENYPVDLIGRKNHPLLHQNPHSLVPFVEVSFNPSDDGVIPEFSSSSSSSPIRLLATHLPRVLLPDSVVGSDCKIVYLCRNLKDLFVSYWHFVKKMGSSYSLEEFFDMFSQGNSNCGPVWDHVLDYWQESLAKPDKVMFLRYEDMKEEPGFQLKRLAEFAGCPITAEEEEQGLVDEILRLCSFQNLSNLEVNQKGKWWTVENRHFFRKGEVGDWKNYLTDEMAERLDQITAQKFHGCGLKLV